MREANIKKNIKYLFEIDKYIVIVDSENLYIDKQIIHIKEYDYLYETRKNIYATKNNTVYKLEVNNFTFNKISDKIITENRLDKKIVITSELISSGKYNVECFISSEIKWNRIIKNNNLTNGESILLERDSFKTRSLTKINLENGEQEWYFALPEGFTVFGKIQVIGDVMFFRATKGVNKFKNIYGLDVNTGNILWEQNFHIPYDENNIAIHINNKDNLCYGYGGKLYQVFNPINGEFVFEKDMSEYHIQGIDPDLNKNYIKDNKIWFVSGKDERAKFGALNIETTKIEFVQDHPITQGGQFDKPVYHKGKLYLRDNNNVLHIFEYE